MSNLLEMRGISKSFYGVEVLHHVDFSIEKGQVIALCGENGAGKSTLMKILAGIYQADEGEILFEGEKLERLTPLQCIERGIAMIHQEMNLVEDLTIAQNVFLGREPRNVWGMLDFPRMNQDAKRYIEQLGECLDPRTKVRDLKVAQKQVVEIAKAVSMDCKLMIMDEPTAVLTDKETRVLFKLVGQLSESGIGIVYISHRLKEIKEICHKVTILRDGGFIASKWVAKISEQEIANLMVGREISQSTAGDFQGTDQDIVLEVRHVSDNLLQDVSFQVRRGEILGFSGLVGAGRTELMEFIFGIRKTARGELWINGQQVSIKSPSHAIRHGIGFATEDRKKTGIIGIRSISENINYVYLMKYVKALLSKGHMRRNNQAMMEKLNIACNSPEQEIRNLSGGNQQKVILAKWLLADSEILILDEPTRGIDVGAREEIYRIIYDMAGEGKTILVVSSDLTEILKICQRIVVMYEGRITGELTGEERTEHNIMSLAADVQAE